MLNKKKTLDFESWNSLNQKFVESAFKKPTKAACGVTSNKAMLF